MATVMVYMLDGKVWKTWADHVYRRLTVQAVTHGHVLKTRFLHRGTVDQESTELITFDLFLNFTLPVTDICGVSLKGEHDRWRERNKCRREKGRR